MCQKSTVIFNYSFVCQNYRKPIINYLDFEYSFSLDMSKQYLANRQTWFLRYRKTTIAQIPKIQGFLYCYQYQGETNEPIFKIGFTGLSVEKRMSNRLEDDNRQPILKFCIPSNDANLLQYYVHDYFFQYRFIRKIFNQKKQLLKNRIQWFQFAFIPLDYVVMVATLMNMFIRNQETSPLVTVHRQVSIMFPDVLFKFPAIYLTEERKIHYQIVQAPHIACIKQMSQSEEDINSFEVVYSEVKQKEIKQIIQSQTKQYTKSKHQKYAQAKTQASKPMKYEQNQLSNQKIPDFQRQNELNRQIAISAFQALIQKTEKPSDKQQSTQNHRQQGSIEKDKEAARKKQSQDNNMDADLQQLTNLFDNLSFSTFKEYA